MRGCSAIGFLATICCCAVCGVVDVMVIGDVRLAIFLFPCAPVRLF
jgi:hypothetical protein